jgi:DNA-binding response OmpR family regulator
MCDWGKTRMSAHVLIIEDDHDIRVTLREVLESEGFTVHSAANGQAGLESLEEYPNAGLVILDLMMPIMNGWQFLKAFRANPVLSSIPVIVISAAHDRVVPSGAQEFIPKPIEFDSFLQTVRQYCRQERRNQPSPSP